VPISDAWSVGAKKLIYRRSISSMTFNGHVDVRHNARVQAS